LAHGPSAGRTYPVDLPPPQHLGRARVEPSPIRRTLWRSSDSCAINRTRSTARSSFFSFPHPRLRTRLATHSASGLRCAQYSDFDGCGPAAALVDIARGSSAALARPGARRLMTSEKLLARGEATWNEPPAARLAAVPRCRSARSHRLGMDVRVRVGANSFLVGERPTSRPSTERLLDDLSRRVALRI